VEPRSRDAWLVHMECSPSLSFGPTFLCLYACTSFFLSTPHHYASAPRQISTIEKHNLIPLFVRTVPVNSSTASTLYFPTRAGTPGLSRGKRKSSHPAPRILGSTPTFNSKSLVQAKSSQHVRLHTSRVPLRTRSVYSQSLVYQL